MRVKNTGKSFIGAIAAAAFVFLFPHFSLAMGPQEEQVKSIATYAIGVIHDLQGETDSAIAAYEKSAKFKSSSATRLRLGADYARLGQLDKAAAELNVLLKEDPDNVQGRYLLALIFTTKKEYDLAAKEYEKILTSLSAADPQNIEIYGYLAQLYYSQKNYDKAIIEFEKVVELNPTENADIIYLLGSLYLEVKKKDRALELFERAIKIDPDHDETLNSLGYLYAENDSRLDEALEMVKRAVDKAPRNGAYLDSLGYIYYKKGDYAKAVEYLDQADSYLKDPVIYEHLGDVYFKMGEKQNAKKYWTLSLKLLPGQDQVIQKLKSLSSL